MRSTSMDRVWEIPIELGALESQIASLRFAQLQLIGELDRLVPAGFPDAAREEVAVACRISDSEARKRLDTARATTTPPGPDGTVPEPRLAATAQALADGEVSLAHAQAMTTATDGLDVASSRWVEASVLDDPRARTPGQLACRARKAALQVGAEQAQRRAAAQAGRELLAFEFDGRVCFSWSMPSLDAAIVAGWLDGRSGCQGSDDRRPAAQRRADALYDLVATALESGDPDAGGDPVRPNLPHVDVLATHESLLDRVWREAGTATAHQPIGGGWAGARIDGRSVFGAQLRQLGCDADLRVSMLDQFGCLLDQGRTTRVVSARLRGLLHVRDQHCRFPGCQVLARRCHAHHLWHWADGGPTDLQNLIMLCDRHHHGVHDGGWAPALQGDGTVAWTSPAGQTVTTPAELDTLSLPPPEPDPDNDHPDGHWIRPSHEFFRLPPPDALHPAATAPDPAAHDTPPF